MIVMDDEELTRQAVAELLRDAKRFMNKREAEFRATQMKRPIAPNKTFLGNTLRAIVTFNNSQSSNRAPCPSKTSENRAVKKDTPKDPPKSHKKSKSELIRNKRSSRKKHKSDRSTKRSGK